MLNLCVYYLLTYLLNIFPNYDLSIKKFALVRDNNSILNNWLWKSLYTSKI